MDLGHVLVVLAVVMGAVALIGLLLMGFVIWRFRIPMRGIVAMGAALLYLVSPIDVLPDVLGPLGLVDDAGVVGMTVLFVYKLIQAQRMLRDAGVDFRRPPRTLRRSPKVTVRDPRTGRVEREPVRPVEPQRSHENWWRDEPDDRPDDQDPPVWGSPSAR